MIEELTGLVGELSTELAEVKFDARLDMAAVADDSQTMEELGHASGPDMTARKPHAVSNDEVYAQLMSRVAPRFLMSALGP